MIAIHNGDGPGQKLPNLALMRIASFWRSHGEKVQWWNPARRFERVYSSRLFAFSQRDPRLPVLTIEGGTGFDLSVRLPDEIEGCQPDYSIYPASDVSIQFFSRGCIRRCPFCVVHKKEGYIHPVDPVNLNPQGGGHIEVLDNNFFANPLWRDSVRWLLASGRRIVLHGVDIRLMDDEQASALNQLRHKRYIHFAWDNPMDRLEPRIKALTARVKSYRLVCYVLIGYWSTPEEDLYRVMWLRSVGISPYVMPFDRLDPYQRRFARWVNHKAVFKTVRWSDYR